MKKLKKGSFDLFIFIYLFDFFNLLIWFFLISGPGLESSMYEANPPHLGFSMFDGIKFFQQKYLSRYLFICT